MGQSRTLRKIVPGLGKNEAGERAKDEKFSAKLNAQSPKKWHDGSTNTEYDSEQASAKRGFRAAARYQKIADTKKKDGVKEEAEQIEEAGYSAKAAAAGKDIGKPGKQFAKIAKKAAEKYGSKERGEKVAGAVLAKLRKEDVLRDLANGLSESNVDLMVSVFEQLSEDNQDRFLDACQTPEGLDAMLDFSITNRNK